MVQVNVKYLIKFFKGERMSQVLHIQHSPMVVCVKHSICSTRLPISLHGEDLLYKTTFQKQIYFSIITFFLYNNHFNYLLDTM